MTFEDIQRKIEEKLAYAPEIGAKVKIDFGDDGTIFVDGTQSPPIMSEDGDDPDTTFITSLESFKGIINGTLDPTMAFMTGKLKVQGSMGYALKIASLLED